MRGRWTALGTFVLLLACSESPDLAPPGNAVGSAGNGGSTMGGVGGSSGQTSAGSAGVGGMSPGGAGMGGVNLGGAGAGSAGSSGSGGAGGSAQNGCIEQGTPGKTGRQCDPGTDGNGTFDQMQPAAQLPAEALGEPEGELSPGRLLPSAVFGYSFNYRTYRPKAYQPGKPAALMIFQDGGNYVASFKAPRLFDALIAEGAVPVTISVYIDPTNQRSKEYDTRDAKYGTMITEELIPELRKTFDLVEDPNGFAIGGHSSGGGCAFNVAWQFPDQFRKVLTHSGTFVNLQQPGNYDYVSIVKQEPKRPLRITLLAGSNDLVCCGTTWFQVNNEMAESLTTAGYPYRYMKSVTNHGPSQWHFNDFPVALRWLWRGYTLPHYATTP